MTQKRRKKAYIIFEQLGLKPTQAFNLSLKQVVLNGGLPFELKVPNVETLQAMKELDQSSKKVFNDSDEFFADLENDD